MPVQPPSNTKKIDSFLTTIAILTNARAADQRSMIGYGDLVLEAARQCNARVVEWRGASVFARLPLRGFWRKLALNLDRFAVTPLTLLGRKADVVHVVDPGNCIYLPLTRHRRSILTVHDMIPYLARDGRLPGFKPTRSGRWLMERIVRQLAQVDQIVCVSEASKRDLLSYIDVPQDGVRVIYNAVFQPMKPATPASCAAFRAKVGVPSDAPVILHVGRNFYKNRETVLDVFARVRVHRPDVHLVMVGALTPELEMQAEALGLGLNLHVLPRVDREDMAALYSTSAVLLFPSLYEGFGLPVLEAQMCGTPVVASDAGSLPEVAAPHVPLHPPTATAQLAASTLEKLAHSVAVRSDGAGAIRDDFSVDNWTAAHMDLYSQDRP